VGGQGHAPAALPSVQRPGTHSTEGWVGLGVSLDGCGIYRPSRDSIPGPWSQYWVAIPTELSRPVKRAKKRNFKNPAKKILFHESTEFIDQFLSCTALRQRGTVNEEWLWTWQTMEETITISWLPLLERISFLESRRNWFRQPKSNTMPYDRTVRNYKIFDQHWESPDSFNELTSQVPQSIEFMDLPPTDCWRQKWLNLRIVVTMGPE
jgi:hypothetical protein